MYTAFIQEYLRTTIMYSLHNDTNKRSPPACERKKDIPARRVVSTPNLLSLDPGQVDPPPRGGYPDL